MRKNLLVTIVIILVANYVSAQSTRFGIYAGPVATSRFEKVAGKKHMHNYMLGVAFGILLDVPMQKIGSFQPGLNYVGKNSKDNFKEGANDVRTTTNINYVEVPLNVIFRIPNPKGNVTLGGGVAAAMALDGKMTTTTNVRKDEKKLKFGDDATADFIKYDFGINILAGYEFKKEGFFVTLNYNHGINRLFVGGDPEDKLYNRYFALRVGLLIGGKK